MIGANIDMEKTAENTRHFLEHDLPMLASMADKDITALSSPQLSWAPAHTNGKNHQQDMIIDYVSSDTAIQAVHAAAHHIPDIDSERQIFILTYFRNWSEKQLETKFAISRSTLNRRKFKSLVEFAIRLDVQKDKPQHQCGWLTSLVAYN